MPDNRALERAIRSLERALQENPDLMPSVAQRMSRLENFELKDGFLYFTLERHPHVFEEQTLGKESSGYFTVEQRYSFNPSDTVIEFLGEECIDMVVDVDELVYEDLQRLFEVEDLDRYKDCTSEEEVRTLAQGRAGELITMVSESTLLEPTEVMMYPETLGRAWREFCDEFEELWCSAFVARVVDEWTEMKEAEEDMET